MAFWSPRTFRPRFGVGAVSGSCCLPPLGTTFELAPALAQDGTVTTIDPQIITFLLTVPELEEVPVGTGAAEGGPVPTDSFGQRFPDRLYRRRF